MMRMVTMPRPTWGLVLATLLLVLAITACNSSSGPTASAPPTATRTTASATQIVEDTVRDVSSATATPTDGTVPTSVQVTATATAKPAATNTPTPTPAPTASATPTPTATSTPTPELHRVTSGGCCTQPFWSPDSQQVFFIDKPSTNDPTGIWGVDAASSDATPELVTERIAFYTGDLLYAITREQGETVVERLEGPLSDTVLERWTVPNGGRSVSLSPGRTRVAWEISDDNLPPERRVTQLWVADFDGSEAQRVTTLPRGGLVDWLSEDTLLVSGRESLESQVTTVYSLSLIDGSTVELVRAERPRGLRVSPDGRWLVYYVSLSDDPEENGMWLVSTDGSQRRALDEALFGAYQWREAHSLVIVPFQPNAVYHELLELDAETGEVRRLTNPDVTSFKIANGDWQISPDGRQIAFVEARDRNIWVLRLAD